MNQQQLSLPHSMRYGIASQQSVKSTCNLRRFDPNNGGTFDSSGANEIRISLQAPGFMDTSKHLIQFEITGKHGVADANLDFDIGCIIDQVRLESMGTVLERLDRYQIFNVAKSCYCNNLTEMASNEIIGGGRALRTGASSQGAKIGFGGENDATKTFGLQLRSGLLVNKHKHAIPMGSPPIELIIRLNSSAQALVGENTSTDAAYEIRNVRFTCPVYTIEDESVMEQYREVLASQSLQFTGTTYKAYVGAIDTSTSSTVQINDRSKSLLALVGVMRPAASINTYVGVASLSLFSVTSLSRYTYNIGGQQYPPGGVECDTDQNKSINLVQLYDQARKALSDSNHDYCNGLLTIQSVCGNGTTKGNDCAKGVMSVDLRSFSDRERSMVGLDTASNAQPMTLELNFAEALPAHKT